MLQGDKNTFLLTREEKKIFKYLLLYSFIFVLPIILANVYYVDDIGRSMDGRFAWMNDGRPLMAVMAQLLSMSRRIMPIFPVPLLLGVTLFTYTFILLARKYAPETNHLLFKSGALAFSFTNLFLLENFSYSFEALGMIISLSLFSIPYLLNNKNYVRKSIFITFVISLCALCFYQASIGWYLGLSLMEFFAFMQEGKKYKEIFINWMQRIIPMMIATIFYKLVIAKTLVKNYAADHEGLVHIGSSDGIVQILNNIHGFGNMLKAYLETLGPVLVGLFVIMLGFIYYYFLKECLKKSLYTGWKKAVGVVLIILAPAIIGLSSLSPYLLLKSPVFACRVFLPFTVFTFFIGILAYQVGKKCKIVRYILPLFLLFNLSFSAAYGIALKREDQHDAQIAQYLVYDINQIEQERMAHFDKIGILGVAPRCHEMEFLSKAKPLMSLLVPSYLNNDWYWAGEYIKHFRKRNVQNTKLTEEDRKVIDSTKPIKQNEYYALRVNGDKVLISFQ